MKKRTNVWGDFYGTALFFVITSYLVLIVRLFNQLPFHIGIPVSFLYLFLVIKTVVSVFSFRMRYGSKKTETELVLFPFLAFRSRFSGTSSGIRFGEMTLMCMLYVLLRPVLVIFLGRWLVYFVARNSRALIDFRSQDANKDLLNFIENLRSRTSYVGYSLISGVFLTLFIAVAGCSLTLFTIGDDKLAKLYAIMRADSLVYPLLGEMAYFNDPKKFECRGFSTIERDDIEKIQESCLKSDDVARTVISRLSYLESKTILSPIESEQMSALRTAIRSGNPRAAYSMIEDISDKSLSSCAFRDIRKRIGEDVATVDGGVPSNSIDYIYGSPQGNRGVVFFQSDQDLTGIDGKKGLLKGMKCSTYDVDKYLSDRVTIAIVALLVYSSVFFAAISLMVFVMVATMNVETYLNKRYYGYLLDVTFILKLN